MSTTTPRSGTPLLAASQAQKHVTHNEALLQLDALVNARILDRNLAAPPVAPIDGDAYLVAANPTGLWAGQSGKIAFAVDGGWRFYAPFIGLTIFVADESVMLIYTATGWKDFASVMAFQNVPLLGVNTTADAANKFALKSNAVLFAALEAANGGTGDMQVKLNKETAAKTDSLLYQTSFSGRAEMGLTGDDNFHLKVSPDNVTWKEAIVVDKATGNVGIGMVPSQSLSAKGVVSVAEGDSFGRLILNPYNSVTLPWSILQLGTGSDSFRMRSTTDTDIFYVSNSGMVGIGNTTPTGFLDVNDDHLRVRTAKTPATSAAAGNQGDIAWDASYVYVCVAANAWKRAALASW